MFICRVCLERSDKLISLKSDSIDALPILHMLSEFTIINAEPQLPKYICENCAENLDIAYAFKRKYEDSIVKFMRQTAQGDEMSRADIKIYSQEEDRQDDDEQYERMPIRILDVRQLSYAVVNDSSIDQEIDIEEMDIKLFTDSTPAPLMEGISSNQTHDEMAGHSIENNNDSMRIDSSDESMSAANERQTAQGSSSIVFNQDYDLHTDTELKYSPNSTTCVAPRIAIESLQSLHSDVLNNQTIGLAKLNLPQPGEPGMVKGNTQLDGPQTMGCSVSPQNLDLPKVVLTNVILSQAADDTESKCKPQQQVHYRILRSNSHRSQEPLTNDILNKIYRNHNGRSVKPYRCDVCLRWFKTKGHIKTHRLRHIERDRTIKCLKCQLTFLTKPHYGNHICSHGFLKNFQSNDIAIQPSAF